MNLDKPIIKYDAVDIGQLRQKMLQLPAAFWEIDRASRVKLAGNRPGNAVFFYNDLPPCIHRDPLAEAANSGFISVLRYANRPLFAEIQTLIEKDIMPCFQGCDVLRVQLAELPPGGIIQPHHDAGILARIHRLHVPIVTHEHVYFMIGGQLFFLEEGTLYDLNNVMVHAVMNKSNVMRVHLMVDMLPHSVARTRYYDTEELMVSTCAG